MTAPTAVNILSNIDFTGFKNRVEERVAFYLQRYINSSSPHNLELLLQFCTSCTTVDHNAKIKVEYVNQDSSYLNIASKTCFKILYIPRQVDLLIFSKQYAMVVYKTQTLGDLMIISFAIRDLFSAFEFCYLLYITPS